MFLAATSPIWLLPASQPSWRFTVWVLAWAKPPDGNRPAAAKPVATLPCKSLRRLTLIWRILISPLSLVPTAHGIDWGCSRKEHKFARRVAILATPRGRDK